MLKKYHYEDTNITRKTNCRWAKQNHHKDTKITKKTN